MESLDLDTPDSKEARRGIASVCRGPETAVSSRELDNEVVVSIELGAGLNGAKVCVEVRDGVLHVHLPRMAT